MSNGSGFDSRVSAAGMGTVFGIDSHARTTTVCALVPATGEVEARTFRGNDYGDMLGWMTRPSLPGPRLGVYEAGCTGYVPARLLSGAGLSVVPIAPSKVPTSSESRARKNDRADAERLARLAVAGELRAVWVPGEDVEGLRDLSHALEDLAAQRDAARRRVEALLCRHGEVFDERTPRGRRRKAWGAAYREWLAARRLPSEGSRAALEAAVRAERSATEQHDALLARAEAVAAASPLAGAVDALRCMKCVGFVTALAYCAEVGDFSRFPSGRRVTSYLGLAPSESSSGLSTRNGAATKCGPALLRRLLAECSWAAGRLSAARPKACPAGVDARVAERARTLSARLAERRRDMLARGVQPCKANAATAAELGRFLLFLGKLQQEVEAEAARAAA